MSAKGSRRDQDQEMSMEEILASIRKYVTDGDSPTPKSDPLRTPSLSHYDSREDHVLSVSSESEDFSPTSYPITAEHFAKHHYEPKPSTASYVWDQDEIKDEVTPSVVMNSVADEDENPHENILRSLSVDTKTNTKLELKDEMKVDAKHASQKSFERLIEHTQALKEKEAELASIPQKKESPDMSALESLALRAMTPMIEKWLDENLSNLVEQLVQKEIERLTQSLLKR